MMMTSCRRLSAFGFVLMFSGLAGGHGPVTLAEGRPTLGGSSFSGRDIPRKCRQLQAAARVRFAKGDGIP